jgi:AcrR family transcriptional regulator
MSEVARQAGASKATVYFYFTSKQELFKAALDDLLSRLPAATALVPASSEESISEQLLVVAKRVNQLLSSMSFELVRRTLASDIAAPLRERIWKAAGLPYFEAINDYLLVQADRGALNLKDSRSAASLFIALIAGGKALHSQLSGSSFGFIEEDHLREAVELFIKGHAPQPSAGIRP